MMLELTCFLRAGFDSEDNAGLSISLSLRHGRQSGFYGYMGNMRHRTCKRKGVQENMPLLLLSLLLRLTE